MKRSYARRTFLKLIPLTVASKTSLASTLQTRQQSAIRSKLRFAVASDGHFGQPETNYLQNHRELIVWLNEESGGKGLDFVVFNGDVIHNDPSHLPQLKEFYDQLAAPYFVCKGNHDMATAQLWQETWGYEENHCFEIGDYAFLLGTTSNEAGDYLAADSDWLNTQLNRYESKKSVFVFLHICQQKVTRHAISAPEVIALFQNAENLAAVFHGHDHDIDNVIYLNEMPFLFDGHYGGSWGTNYRGYRVVEIDETGEIRTYQCNPQALYVNSATISSPRSR
jgi:3',5'-cyclic AMP phosphodiesterase CpdA